MTRFVTTSRGMYATVPLLIVVLTIIFTLACGADNTTPVPTSETPADSPTTAQETTAGPTDTPGAASTSSPTPAAVATPTASAAPSPRVGPTPAPETDGNPGADTCSDRDIHAGPFAHGSSHSRRDAYTNGCAGSDAHSHCYACSRTHGDTLHRWPPGCQPHRR